MFQFKFVNLIPPLSKRPQSQWKYADAHATTYYKERFCALRYMAKHSKFVEKLNKTEICLDWWSFILKKKSIYRYHRKWRQMVKIRPTVTVITISCTIWWFPYCSCIPAMLHNVFGLWVQPPLAELHFRESVRGRHVFEVGRLTNRFTAWDDDTNRYELTA